jgi:hypothetical protein
MTAVPAQPSLEQLSGLVERVTFHNADSGFCVLRLKVRGERDLVTLVGHAPSVTPGEYAAASGSWVTDREHGRQFRAVFVKIAPPNTLAGIERYLGSGMVKGIGPVYASRLVGAFGTAAFDVIEQLFIGRFLQHVLSSGFKRIRHYGLLAPATKADRLATARALLAMPTPNPKAIEDAQAFMRRVAAIEITCCPHCRLGHWQLVQQLPADRAALASNMPRAVACRGPP